MRIIVTSLAVLYQKKEQKALVFKKRESEKKKVDMPSQKEAREGKLLKGVPLPPNIPHTCTS
jgi:hypothetical protein